MSSCPNCGLNIDSNDSFCRVCETKIYSPQNNLSNNIQKQNLNNNSSEIIINELLDCYIDENAEELKNKDFSYNTLFWGVIYLFYRKILYDYLLISPLIFLFGFLL